MASIRIQFTRFSAFYSPLIATVAGGFLEKEGLEGDLSVAEHGVSALEALLRGDVDLVQSAQPGLCISRKRRNAPSCTLRAN